eukprot:CAMPEP_0194753574 /NCGR_PEP_ID=MMETSP0323_2-20130528/7524_1 /TAXON_ID=2866 ORGANISM="Crypthecodinium cohnii, Strain Seligo" /NCGR_SAMPLE_ID=MMETSP0323_2 /ASSEMBLY_ACC=CAM_ASM_000346 /LENGTH=97 /DNA_ID=CAMNT_0039671507 /DNA_START=28 /DNA_END=321 /DNA_ORIENTATION=+
MFELGSVPCRTYQPSPGCSQRGTKLPGLELDVEATQVREHRAPEINTILEADAEAILPHQESPGLEEFIWKLHSVPSHFLQSSASSPSQSSFLAEHV